MKLDETQYIGTQFHGFDLQLKPILSSIWFCLHLPRNAHDTFDIPPLSLRKAQDLDISHHIILLPVPWPSGTVEFLREWSSIFVITPDELAHEAENLINQLQKGTIYRVSQLDDESLSTIWACVHENSEQTKPLSPIATSIGSRTVYPGAVMPANLIRRHITGAPCPSLDELPSSKDKSVFYGFHWQAALATNARLHEHQDSINPEEVGEKWFAEERERVTCHVTLAVPGVSSTSTRINRMFSLLSQFTHYEDTPHVDIDHKEINIKSDKNMDKEKEIEDQVIDFLITHRALARTGIGLRSNFDGDDLFPLVDQLERHFRDGSIRPRYVNRELVRIGNRLADILGEECLRLLNRARSLTVFSNLPVEWTRLPGRTDPLCYITPVSRRPLLPLTRALQFELTLPLMMFWRKGFSILLAECIPINDPIGPLSRNFSNYLAQFIQEEVPSVDFETKEIFQKNDLVDILAQQKYDVLILSAHGVVSEERNVAGIICGDDILYGPELPELPPLVILSACSTSPRGRGLVNIGDECLRQGAKAVVSTFAPVDVNRNAKLLSRFIANMSASIENEDDADYRTVMDAWYQTVATNTVNDVMDSYPRQSINKPDIVYEFMTTASRGRLRQGHVIDDTIEVLCEQLGSIGEESPFRAWLQSQGFLPETLLYTISGWPERIILRDEQLEGFAGV